jgi:hypothetical protein
MPRKPSEEKSPKNKPRVRFIFEPDRTSPNGITYSWLIHGTYNGKEKAATATRAFWLPFAYEATGEYSEDELQFDGNIGKLHPQPFEHLDGGLLIRPVEGPNPNLPQIVEI